MTDDPKKLLTLEEEDEQTILQHMREFRGIGTTMESALGALIIGQYFGWRVLKLLHNPATYRKYEKVLGVKFQKVCPEITEMGKKKSIGYAITDKLNSFWAVVMGRRKVPEKGMIGNKDEVSQAVDQIDQEGKKMTYSDHYVTIDKCAELYGLTKEAIRQYKKKGQWREKIHWYKAPNGRIFINIKAVNAWIVGKEA